MTVRYRRHPDLRLASLEDGGVVLHLGTRRYFTVSESGRAILETLASPQTSDALVAVMLARYDVTAKRAAASVREFVERCRAAHLVVIETES